MRKLLATLILTSAFAISLAFSVTAEQNANPPIPSGDPDTVLAQYNIPLDLGPEGESLALSLEQAVGIALANNLGIEGVRYNFRSAKEAVNAEDAAFDSIFFADIPLKREKTRTTTGSSIYSEAGYEIGIKRRLRTGTYYQIAFTDELTRYTTPLSVNRATMLFTVAQPLLRNAGRSINNAQYEIAVNNREISMLTLENRINELIYQVSAAYWGLVLAKDGLEVALRAKNLAEELYRTTDNLVKSGAEKELARLQALNGVASREEDVLLARLGVKNAEDNLIMLLNLRRDGSIPDMTVVLSDRPDTMETPCNFEECISYALNRRADLRSARLGLAIRKIAMDVAKNQTRPRFDLTAAVALTGISSEYAENIEGMFRSDYYTWQVGFTLEHPLGNRAALASLRKAEEEFKASKINVLAAEQGVLYDVRTAIRNVRTNYRRIASAMTARMLAERTLNEETERYRVGRSTSIEVLRFQTDLIAAQNRELRAIIDYNLSIANLNRARFTNLQNYRVNLNDVIDPTMNVPDWNANDTYRPLMNLSKDSSTTPETN